MLGSCVDAEDAVQETLIRAWRASGRFEGRASLRTWLYRIARNVCLDALAQSGRRPVPVEEMPEPPDADPGGDPSDRALERERLHRAVIAAVRLLPPRQRAVLMLRDVLAWPAAEVADLLEMSSVAVNSALQRAHAALEAIDLDGLSEANGDPYRALVGRYVSAFAEDDVDALVALSRDCVATAVGPGC
jgi:RNA polymerase sigma-70 factor (ECF subfamily)